MGKAGGPVEPWVGGDSECQGNALLFGGLEPVLQPPPQNLERGKPKRKGAGIKKPTGVLSESSLLPLKSLFALHFGVFLPLHPAVLEPDLDLSLVET